MLDKSNLTLQVGSVQTVTQPTGYNMPWMNPLPGQTMDISVVMEDGSVGEFKQLNPTLSTALYGNTMVCETQEQMSSEIDNLDRQSASVLESVEFHKKARTAYEGMKRKLSPSYAKDRMTDDRLTKLEQSNAQMANGISQIQAMLSQMQTSKSK